MIPYHPPSKALDPDIVDRPGRSSGSSPSDDAQLVSLLTETRLMVTEMLDLSSVLSFSGRSP